MKYSKYRKCMSLLTAGALVISLAACSNSSQTEESQAQTETQAVEMTDVTVPADMQTTPTVNGLDEELCSWTTGGTDASSLTGNDYEFTPVIYINGGVYDTEKSVIGDVATVTDTEASNINMFIEKVGVNGIMINDSDYTIKDSVINLSAGDADGSTTCDFSGLGSAIAVYGDSNLTISNTEINADGVANLAVFTDNGASALLENVTLHADGGSLYEDYVNSPNQGTMVAPPWILGIMGNARDTNLEGTDSTMTVIDSAASASNWAVLSTDAGSNMYLNVVNTTMDLTGNDEPLQADGLYDVENPYTDKNGYGTYVIGDAVETFLGTTMNVGTYATIFTGGTGYYGNLTAGESYDLLAADGTTHYTYTAQEDVTTVINSDTFGFMAHQGNNECTLDGVVVNSPFTNFLIKSGNNTTINVENGTQLNAENGILLQLMDNDDSTTEFNTNHETVGMAFGTTHEEYAGFPAEAIDPDAASEGDMGGAPADMGAMPEGEAPADMGAMPEGEAPADMGAMPEGEAPADMGASQDSSVNTSVYNVKDTALTGSIYNGIGWNANELSQGKIKQMILEVNLSGASTLSGAIASTSCIHSTYEGQMYLKENGITAFDDEDEAAEFADSYQAVSFTIAEYFNIGQVANLVKYNGLNDIHVTVSDDSVWTVTGTSLIKSLMISGNAQVVVEDSVTLTVDGTVYEAGTYTAADFQ